MDERRDEFCSLFEDHAPGGHSPSDDVDSVIFDTTAFFASRIIDAAEPFLEMEVEACGEEDETFPDLALSQVVDLDVLDHWEQLGIRTELFGVSPLWTTG